MNFPDYSEVKGIYSTYPACCRYNYVSALQLLGLGDTVGPGDRDPVLMRGTYLSFLYLHHLGTRELLVGGGPGSLVSAI